MGETPRYDSDDFCTICGKSKDKAYKFYKTVDRAPFCDQLYLCDECYSVLKERAKWFQNRKVEVIK